MSGDEPLFALARAGDPDTSHEAAASVGDVRQSQRTVWWLLFMFGPEGATDEELVEMADAVPTPMSPSGIRTRRSELVRRGLVEWTGEKRVMATGRRARVWRTVGRVPSS